MRVVIFGAAHLASLAWFMLAHDSLHRVVSFTVDGRYLPQSDKHGLPVVAFERLEEYHSPAETAVIAPLGLSTARGVAGDRVRAAKARGYATLSHVSSRAVTWPDLRLGDNSMICDGVVIEPFARIGDNVFIRGSCHLSHHAAIDGNCFLGPRVTIAGDVHIGEGCFLGLGATVHSGVRIARGCVIAAGSEVTRDTQEGGVYDGTPARRRAVPVARVTRI